MKKFIFIFAVLFLFSCTKEYIPVTDNLVTVTFTSNLITGGLMTKSSGNEFEELLAANLPEEFPILLKSNRTGNKFTTVVGKSITVPEDEYTISTYSIHIEPGYHDEVWRTDGYNPLFGIRYCGNRNLSCCPIDDKHIGYLNDYAIADTPVFTVKPFTKQITNKDNTIEVNIKYNCVAIFYLKDEIKQIKLSHDIGTSGNISDYTNINGASSSDKYKLIYVYRGWCGQENTFSFGFTIIPSNYDVFEDTIIALAYGLTTATKHYSDGRTEIIDISYKNNIEKGKYYILHPNKINSTAGSIIGGFEDMTCGGEI